MSSVSAWILYEDNHLLAVNKPGNLLTQDSGTGSENLEDLIKAYLKQRDQKSGNVFLHVVHRLDRPASGIVLCAKTSKGLSRLNAAMRQRLLRKSYLAVVEGMLDKPTQRLENWLLHEDRCARVVSEGYPNAQQALLTYQVLLSKEALSLVDVELETGRYHQIRAQLAELGCPILGDERYGASPLHQSRSPIALHHHRLSFPHPTTKKEVVVMAPVPAWWPLRPHSLSHRS